MQSLTLDYTDLQSALKTSRGKVTLHSRLSDLDYKWRVVRAMLDKAERICAETSAYTADSESRQWAEEARARYTRNVEDCRAELAAILRGQPVAKHSAAEPAERITQTALF